ncbi:MAG: imidazole glycerol phosphate synthase subunit HisH [Candidatus Omnitrophica bacterium]|nr:imidazole glycerol phosphate synthase subunit HisH [Candidatus Omnitrophota bacterium]
MIAIIDYGMGNLRSVQKALEKVGARAQITHNTEDISKAQKVVLPGVGAMAPAMQKLKELGLVDVVRRVIKEGKPFLGICLGLQLLFEKSSEGGYVEGLSIIPGTVERFTSLKVPHMGWNQINIQSAGQAMFKGINSGENVYFCHSYFVQPKDKAIAASITTYGIDCVSSVVKGNIWGVQFHPEKSQTVGLQILKNFVAL